MKGRCYCGDVHYEVTEAPLMKGQCHCRECQYITGGGPNFFMALPASGFTVTKGTLAGFKRDDIEAPRLREFCPRCGTHVTTQNLELGLTIVKVGTLDDPADYGGPKMAIFHKDAPSYHEVAEGLPCFAERPPAK